MTDRHETPRQKTTRKEAICIQIRAASKRYRNPITDYSVHTAQQGSSQSSAPPQPSSETVFFLTNKQFKMCWWRQPSRLCLSHFTAFLTPFSALPREVLSKRGQTGITTTLGRTLNKSYAGWSEKGKNLQRASISKLKFEISSATLPIFWTCSFLL